MSAPEAKPAEPRPQLLQHALLFLSWNFELGEPQDDAERLVQRICSGEWLGVLQTPLVKDQFTVDSSGEVSVALAIPTKPLTRLAICTALLSAYVQVNFTGPPLAFTPIRLFPNSQLSEAELNAASIRSLSLAGEPAYHLAQCATFLRLAELLLDHPPCTREEAGGLDTAPWWRLRAATLHHRLVGEPIPLPSELLASVDQLLEKLPEMSATGDGREDWLAALTVERGLAEIVAGDERKANTWFRQAVNCAGLHYALTGVLGKRTKFQEHEHSQLVVLAAGRARPWARAQGAGAAKLAQPLSSPATPQVTDPTVTSRESAVTEHAVPTALPLNSDVLLEHTQFTSTRSAPPCPASSALSAIDPSDQPTLHPLDQCILLALSLCIRNTSPSHGLTSSQIYPFVSRVLADAQNWSVHTLALLLRSRLEATRTKTVERGLLQHQALVEQLGKERETVTQEALAPATDRIRWTWAMELPSRWDLAAELARKLRALGVTRSALAEFERLEMWEEVVGCWQSLEVPTEAVKLVKQLLSGEKRESDVIMGKVKRDRARDARLWCLLGELEGDPGHFETAWDVSGHTSSRAMRSLGAWAFSQGDFARAESCLRAGLKINPLFQRSWFALGCCAMKLEHWETAEEAFARSVALEEDDPEAWNNLASVHLRLASDLAPAEGTASPVLSATAPAVAVEALGGEARSDKDRAYDRRRAAFRCLQRAAQLSYDSWKIWSNYMVVSMSVGEAGEALRALERVVAKRGAPGLDYGVLEGVLAAGLEADGAPLRRRLEDAFQRTLLPAGAAEPRVFLLHAKLRAAAGDLRAALAAHLSALRVGVTQDEARVQMDRGAFEAAAVIVQGCVDALRNWGPREQDGVVVKPEWRWQARTLLRSFLGRTKDAWEETDEWMGLKEEMESLKGSS